MTSQPSGKIRITPLFGGQTNTAVCSLLELGGSYRLLMDCGFSGPNEYDYLETVAKDLLDNGGVDCILLSHGDLSHVGALPIFAGENGLSDTPIVCTLPVHKYSQLVLYDFVLNQEMEGEGMDKRKFSLDDIDHAFQKVTTLRFSQTYTLPPSRLSSEAAVQHSVTIEALPSGRTIGGTIWKIRCGPAELLYTMDINLRKEILLDAASLDLLPTSPALMICDASSPSRITTTKKKKEKDDTTQMINSILETVRDGGNVLIPCETAGRVLELLLVLNKYWTENRLGLYHLVLLSHMANNILEFARYQLEWVSDSVAKPFYNGKANPFDLTAVKCFQEIRHMEKQCPGPKVVLATDSSLTYGLSKELLLKWGGDKRCRIIFIDQDTALTPSSSAAVTNNSAQTSSTSSLSATAVSTRTLAEELKRLSLTPPVICSVNIPIRVPLQGQELDKYLQQQQLRKEQLEEEILRRKRKNEINKFALAKEEVKEEEEEEEEEDEEDVEEGLGGGEMPLDVTGLSVHEEGPQKKKAKRASEGHKQTRAMTASQPFGSSILSYFDTNFKVFETNITHFTIDEYGMSNEDLQFKDIGPAEHKVSNLVASSLPAAGMTSAPTPLLPGTATAGGASAAGSSSNTNDPTSASNPFEEEDSYFNYREANRDEELQRELQQLLLTLQETPTKLVARKQTVQFTCDIKSFNFTGKMNFKAMKDLIHHINPQRLLLLSGQSQDFQQFQDYYQSMGNALPVYTPANRELVEFEVFTQSLKVQIPKRLVPKMIKVIQTVPEETAAVAGGSGAASTAATAGGAIATGSNAATTSTTAAFSTIALLKGNLSTHETITSDGVRLIRYLGETKIDPAKKKKAREEVALANAAEAMELSDLPPQLEEEEDEDAAPLIIPTAASTAVAEGGSLLDLPKDESLGVISFQEITLTHLKQQLEATGIKTEFHFTAAGGVLVCNEQVIIRSDLNHRFFLEGPPIKAFFDARKVLYQQVAFI